MMNIQEYIVFLGHKIQSCALETTLHHNSNQIMVMKRNLATMQIFMYEKVIAKPNAK